MKTWKSLKVKMEVAQLCHDSITTKTMGFSKPEYWSG